MSDLAPTLTGLQQALKKGLLSPDESIGAQRARLERLDDRFGCVVTAFDTPDGNTLAPSAEGALVGIGLAHKDIFDLPGRAPGVGHDRGSRDAHRRIAPAIDRLKRCGAAHMAALTMAEYACGATGRNPRFKPCINPLHAQAVVGGSSSGSAVAVSSEMVYGSLGTDTAGSVRIPAATCGLLGLKTTHGLLPTEGVQALAPSLDGVGLLTRSAADAEALLMTLHPALGAAHRGGSTPPRVKAWLPEAQMHPAVERALSQLAGDCQATERLVQLPEYAVLTGLAEIVLHHEAALTHHKALLACTLCATVEAVALPGLAIPQAWYEAAIAARSQHARAFFAAHLKDHDVLLLPALPRPVPDWDSVDADSPNFKVRELLALHQFMGFVNYLGFPSVVIPIAHDERGMPITAQLVGRPHEELTLLALAHTIELQRFGSSGFTRPFSHLKD